MHMNTDRTGQKGYFTDEMQKVAAAERIPAEQLAQDICAGSVGLSPQYAPEHRTARHRTGMRTKVNANIGTSKDKVSYDDEMKKLRYSSDTEPMQSWISPPAARSAICETR